VRGPRWTWISRTVGKMVEVVEGEGVKEVEVRQAKEKEDVEAEPSAVIPSETTGHPPISKTTTQSPKGTTSTAPPATSTEAPQNAVASSSKVDPTPASNPTTTLQSAPTPIQHPEPSQYTRNYLILSQIPGGLPAELSLVLGNHVEWDQVNYIPARNRPVIRRPPRCPFTGKIAKYRHPSTMIPYADVSGYKEIEALLQNRYIWSEGGFWVGGEEDVGAPEAEVIEGWREAMNGGWLGGFSIPPEEGVGEMEVVEEVAEPVKKGRKRGSEAAGGVQGSYRGKKRGRKTAV
jgi:hypothetical protein